jgi:hypothetical protein
LRLRLPGMHGAFSTVGLHWSPLATMGYDGVSAGANRNRDRKGIGQG